MVIDGIRFHSKAQRWVKNKRGQIKKYILTEIHLLYLKNSPDSPLIMFSVPLFTPKSLETKMDTKPGFCSVFPPHFFFLLFNKSEKGRRCFCKAGPSPSEP